MVPFKTIKCFVRASVKIYDKIASIPLLKNDLKEREGKMEKRASHQIQEKGLPLTMSYQPDIR